MCNQITGLLAVSGKYPSQHCKITYAVHSKYSDIITDRNHGHHTPPVIKNQTWKSNEFSLLYPSFSLLFGLLLKLMCGLHHLSWWLKDGKSKLWTFRNKSLLHIVYITILLEEWLIILWETYNKIHHLQSYKLHNHVQEWLPTWLLLLTMSILSGPLYLSSDSWFLFLAG